MKNFFENYIDIAKKEVEDCPVDELLEAKKILDDVKQKNKKLFLFGNGASSSIASHFSLDFTKQAKLKAVTFSDPPTLTAYANDFGYAKSYMKYLESHFEKEDAVIFISCSGNSPNLVNCAEFARDQKLRTISLTGFNGENKLAEICNISLNVNSKSYNLIESIHTLYLAMLCDSLIGKMEYSVS